MHSPSLTRLLAYVVATSAVLLTDPSELTTDTYDFIIVGGGTAGNVVANRLSSSQCSVLVLEAGLDASNDVDTRIPFLGPTLAPGTPLDWNYTTIAQPGLDGRSIPYARGKVLGGSSVINYLVYNRGSSDDWDRYATIANDQSFTWEAMGQYMSRNENFTLPNTTRPLEGEYNPAVHSRRGLLGVSLPQQPFVSLDGPVIRAAHEPSTEFPYQEDMNDGDTIGLGWTQSTVLDGARTDSNSAYLQGILDRPNLTVLTSTQVTKILSTGKIDGLTIFRGVEFATNATAPRIRVTARKEVILAAGSFNTPQLLMLSGIGDPGVLSQAGIQTLVSLPSVGKNMSDHVILSNSFRINSTVNDTFSDYEAPANLGSELAQWTQTGTGPLAEPGFRQLAWLRLPKSDPIFQAYTDPTAGPRSAHFEFILAHGLVSGQASVPGYKYINIVTNVISPLARGWVSLTSKDPFAHPAINPNLLGSPFDKYIMTYALRAAQRLAGAKSFEGYVVDPSSAFGGATTDAELEAYASINAGTVWHAVGTASVSPFGATWGVINPDMAVKKTVGLSVIDAAGIPYVPSGHTQGPVYFWAERAADCIKARYLLR